MMKLQNLYEEMLGVVCDTTGIGETEMLHSNREACVDARSILVNALVRKGVTDIEVSGLTRLTRQCVNKLKNTFHLRKGKWTFDTCWRAVCEAFAL